MLPAARSHGEEEDPMFVHASQEQSRTCKCSACEHTAMSGPKAAGGRDVLCDVASTRLRDSPEQRMSMRSAAVAPRHGTRTEDIPICPTRPTWKFPDILVAQPLLFRRPHLIFCPPRSPSNLGWAPRALPQGAAAEYRIAPRHLGFWSAGCGRQGWRPACSIAKRGLRVGLALRL